jgi:flagellar hook-associated protein 2
MINSSTDIQSLAYQFVQADRAGQDQYFAKRKSGYESSLKLYRDLTSNINSLRDTVRELSANKQFEAFSVTPSAEGYADITAGTNAAAGQYEIHIDQLATAHQVTLSFASETDPMPASGEITLGVGTDQFVIDMASLEAGANLTDLRDAINSHVDNPGMKASIVRTDGSVQLMLSSEETGAANTLTMSTDGTVALAGIQTAMDNRTELSQAQDARIYLGGEGGLELTNVSNRFENVIDGLTINVTKTHEAGESLMFTVGQDQEATKEQLQSLVDGYNKIVDTATKGDSTNNTARMLLNQLRTELSGSGMTLAGLELNRSGKLTINSSRMESYLETNPDGLSEILSGDTGLLTKLEDRLDTFVRGNESMLKSATNSVQSSLDLLNDRMDRFDQRMDNQLDRYIQQFSKMQSMIAQMQQTFNMF